MRSERLLLKTISTSVLILASFYVLWQWAFQLYIQHHPYNGDIFREGIRKAHLPFYIWSENISLKKLLVLLPVIPAGIVLYKSPRPWIKGIMAGIIAIAFAATDDMNRLTGVSAHFQTFAEDLSKFHSFGEIFQNWATIQSQLSIHNQHYPPGIFSLIYILGPSGIWWLSILATGGLTYLVSKYESPQTALLVAIIPSILIFSSLDPGSIYALLSYILYKLLTPKDASISKGLLAGIVLFIFSMLSYMFFWIAALLGLYFLISRQFPTSRLLVTGTATFVLLHLILYAMTGFNSVEVFFQSTQANMLLNHTSGFDDIYRWGIRSIQNLLQFGLAVGPALLLFRPQNGKWSLTIFIVLLIAAFSGLFFGETERVWIPFLPFTALAIAEFELVQKYRLYIFSIGLLSATVLELYFKNYI